MQSKYYVKIASDFEPASWRKISARQRAKNSEFVWENGGKSVGRASRVPPSGFEKAVEFWVGAVGENRTLMMLPPIDFESIASTNSATTAIHTFYTHLHSKSIIKNKIFMLK